MSRSLVPVALPDPLLKRAIPALRNPRFAEAYYYGRERHFKQVFTGKDCNTVPLYSHDATYQSLFTKGWYSVTEQDIRLAKAMKKFRKD